MTVKLGAIEYEKWQHGYIRGYDDGRMGRPRSPQQPTAAGLPAAGTLEPSFRTRAAAERVQMDRPGDLVLIVFHEHGGDVNARHCEGLLLVLKDRLVLQAGEASDGQAHSFDVPYAQIQEIKKNSMTMLFHVKMRDGRNFNFQTPDEPVADAVAQILKVAPPIK